MSRPMNVLELKDKFTEAYRQGFNDGRLVGTNDERDFLLSELREKVNQIPMYPSTSGPIIKKAEIISIINSMERKK